MAFSYKSGSSASNGAGSSATSISVTVGTAPAEGDLVVACINRNTDAAINNDAGGSAWTEMVNAGAPSETARVAIFYKIAGASEPTTYTFSFASGDDYAQICLQTFSSATSAVLDLQSSIVRHSTPAANMVCAASNGATVGSGDLSIIFCGKDNRSGAGANYGPADSSFVNVIGEPGNQASCMAHKIHTTGETLGDVSVTGTSPSDATYAVHFTFVESTGGGSYTLTANSGSFALTGQSASLLANRRLSSLNGSFSLTGLGAALKLGRSLSAGSGAYNLSGQETGLRVSRLLTSGSGSFTLTGQNASLIYTLAGSSYTLAANSGSFTLSGQQSNLRANRKLISNSGSFALAGQDAGLNRKYTLSPANGAFTVAGQDVSWQRSYVISADSGSFSLSASNAALSYSGTASTLQPAGINIFSNHAPIEILSRAKPLIMYSKR